MASAKAIGLTKALLINKKVFLQIIKDFPEDYEMYCQIRDHCTVNNNNDFLKINCPICFSANHVA